jgi:hypothetical protein
MGGSSGGHSSGAVADMSIHTGRVHSTVECHQAVTRLVHASQWFSVLPLPDDHFEITVKKENKDMLNGIIRLGHVED